ncbi:MAG: hypothetical protein RJQ09_01990 [Cyclobacteriaceae bacterium]
MSKEELISQIRELNPKEQSEILNEIRRSTYVDRFNGLLSALSSQRISDEEIETEVEVVRQKRFSEGKHDL